MPAAVHLGRASVGPRATTYPGDQVVRAANWVAVAGGVLVLAGLALYLVLGLVIGAVSAVSAVTQWLGG